jgi:hypothetical protein
MAHGFYVIFSDNPTIFPDRKKHLALLLLSILKKWIVIFILKKKGVGRDAWEIWAMVELA